MKDIRSGWPDVKFQALHVNKACATSKGENETSKLKLNLICSHTQISNVLYNQGKRERKKEGRKKNR